jgi:hypothetical protein
MTSTSGESKMYTHTEKSRFSRLPVTVATAAALMSSVAMADTSLNSANRVSDGVRGFPELKIELDLFGRIDLPALEHGSIEISTEASTLRAQRTTRTAVASTIDTDGVIHAVNVYMLPN